MATNESYLPSEYNTGIVRGDDFSELFVFTVDGEPFSLNGATCKIQIKTSMGVSVGIWTEENGIILVDNTATWNITNSETSAFPTGSHKYDVEITVSGTKKTYVSGVFTVVGDITT